MQIRIGKKFGFVAALAVAVFASQSASGAERIVKTVDLKDVGDITLSGTTITADYPVEWKNTSGTTKNKSYSDNYKNSGEDLRTLNIQLGSGNVTYRSSISENVKVVFPDRTAGDNKYVSMSKQTQTYTGGTEIYGCTVNFNFGKSTEKEITCGTAPISVYVNSKTTKNAGIRLSNCDAVFSTAVNLFPTDEDSSGYQGANATFQSTGPTADEDTGYTRLFKSAIDATAVKGFSIYQGNETIESKAAMMMMSGVINGPDADIYVMSITNSTLEFANNVTAKSLRMAYFKSKQKYGKITLRAGKSFDIGEIQLAGHFLTINGTLTNPECVFNWTLPAQGTGTQGPYGTIDEVIAAGTYDTGGSLADPETSKITLGADQTIDHLTSEALTSGQCDQPGMVLMGTDKTLTLQNSATLAQCYARVRGTISLVLDATDKANTQEFLGRENDTIGTITVDKGVFKIGAGASFPNVTAVMVGADGKLVIGDTVENPFGTETQLALDLAAKECLDVSTSASLTVRQMFIDGVKISQSQIPTLFPGANITITDAAAKLTEATWCGAGADQLVTTKENWKNCEAGVESENYQLTATFATSGTAAEIPADFTFKGLVFNLGNDFAFSGETVNLGVDGISFPSTDEERTVTFNQPVNIAAAQTWTIGGPNSVIDLKSGLSGSAGLTIKSETANTPLTLGFGTENTYAGTLTTAYTFLNFVSPGATLCGPVAIGKVKEAADGSFKAFAVAAGTSNEFKGAVTVTGNTKSMQVDFGAGSSTKFGGKYTCPSTTTTWTLDDGATVEFAGGVSMSGGMTLKQEKNAKGKLVVSGATATAYKWDFQISEVELKVDYALKINNEDKASGVDVTFLNTTVDIGGTKQTMHLLSGTGTIKGNGGVVTADQNTKRLAPVTNKMVFDGLVHLSYLRGTNTLASVSTSTGVLKTKAGGTVLTLAPGSYWAGDVTVEADSTLVLNPKTIAKTAKMTVADGGKVVLADGRVKVASLQIGETVYERGIYYVKELFGEDAGEGRIWVGDTGAALIIR